MRVLLIEDDSAVAETVRRTLARAGHAADVAADARSARGLAGANAYDAILLDLNLPDASGFDLISFLRQANPAVPVLMVSGRASIEDVVHGFEVGADDYITKPFDQRELLARLRAVTRRGGHLECGDLMIDRLKREAYGHGQRIRLAPKEFGILEQLMLAPGRVVTRRALLAQVWGLDQDPDANLVDVQVAHLRTKLRDCGSAVQINVVRGAGYRLIVPPVDRSPLVSA